VLPPTEVLVVDAPLLILISYLAASSFFRSAA
jgi:hypothetical protein